MGDGMPADVARRLFAEGAVLVMLGVPAGTEFGVDYNTWTVGPRFKGVKMVPPGVHFVHYSSARPGEHDTGPRTGFFVELKPQQVVMRQWNVATEALEEVTDAEQELNRHRGGLLALEPDLGPYPFDGLRRWLALTSKLSPAVVTRLRPVSDNTCSKSKPDGPTTAAAAVEAQGCGIRFTHIPRRHFPPGATAAEITRCSMDRSYTLRAVLDSVSNDVDGLLGEVQYAFVSFLICHVLDAFEQWKKLVALLCSCEDALAETPKLFHDFIGILLFELREMPEDFFRDVVSRDNFLAASLRTLYATIDSSMGAPVGLKQRAAMLQKFVTERFNWDFGEEPDEDKPVLV